MLQFACTDDNDHEWAVTCSPRCASLQTCRKTLSPVESSIRFYSSRSRRRLLTGIDRLNPRNRSTGRSCLASSENHSGDYSNAKRWFHPSVLVLVRWQALWTRRSLLHRVNIDAISSESPPTGRNRAAVRNDVEEHNDGQPCKQCIWRWWPSLSCSNARQLFIRTEKSQQWKSDDPILPKWNVSNTWIAQCAVHVTF